MKVKVWQIIGAWLLVAALVPAAAAQAQSDGVQSLPEMVSSARTAADHEKIAAYYDAAAKDAKQRADEHSRLMQAYKNLGGAPVTKLQLDKHCAKLAQSADSESKEYEGLAEAHREMAASVPSE